jgi:predicted enzyme related to lactoylglutathione lyase
MEQPQIKRQTGGAMPNPVVHFEVLGKDAATLQAFYGEVFDWQLNPVMPTYAMVSTGIEGGIPGGVGATPDGGAGHVTFYVQVSDLAVALEQIESAGGRTVQPPMDVPDGPSIALFADPEGHVIGLVKS